MKLTNLPLLSLGLLVTPSLAKPAAATTSVASLTRNHPNSINYSTVTGFFLQDDNATVASTFDYTLTNFGLINQSYPTDSEAGASKTQWQKFEYYVHRLNEAAPNNVEYKILFMGRHGEGYHNVAETYYGTPLWNCYWSLQDGNGSSIWADAKLTPNGVVQALEAAAFWASRIALQKIPVPETYYTSPLTRCLQTANLTFSALDLPKKQPFSPTVKELFREGISGHTCDRRGNKTYIHNSFPTYKFEKGFSEQDLLWRKGVGEVGADQDIRSKAVLDDVFRNDDSTWISITSHSGEIGSILRVLNHRVFSLSTGAVIPVFVKAETMAGKVATSTTLPWTTISTCASPVSLTVAATTSATASA